MAGHWYCKISGQTSQPLSPQELKGLATSGQLGPNDLVRHGNEGPWIPAICVKGLMPSDPSEATLPQPMGQTAAETARRGPAKYATQPKPKPAPARKAKPLPTAQPMDEPPAAAASVPSAAPRPAPARARPKGPAAPSATGPASPPSFSAPAESATHRALGRNATTPRARQRNNMMAVVILTVAAIALGVVGVVALSNREALFGESDAASAKGKPAADGDAGAAEKPAAAAEKTVWTDASKPISKGDAQVQISSVEIGRPPGASARMPNVLLVTVKVQNTNGDKELKFIPWSEGISFEKSVRLVDDRDKAYGRKVYRKRTASAAETEGPQPGQVNEVHADDFERDVLHYDGLVLVSFWSPGQDAVQPEPAQQRQRELHDATVEQLAARYPDDLRVVKFNIDEDRSLASRYEIHSVPTMALFRGGKCLETAKGQASRLGIQTLLEQELSSPEAKAEPVAPGAAAEDLLLFDLPAEGAKYLRLTLPAAAVGASGTVDFEIPRKLIRPAKPAPVAEQPATEPGGPVAVEPKPEPGEETPAEPSKKPEPTVEPEPGMEEPEEEVDQGEEEFKKLFDEELSGEKDPMGLDNTQTDFTKKPGTPSGGEEEPKPLDRKTDRR